MSRGPGQTQQRVLEALTAAKAEGRAWRTTYELTAEVYGTPDPTPAQYETVRRAVTGLVRRGEAEVIKAYDVPSTNDYTRQQARGGQRTRGSHRAYRLPRTPEELAADEARRAEWSAEGERIAERMGGPGAMTAYRASQERHRTAARKGWETRRRRQARAEELGVSYRAVVGAEIGGLQLRPKADR